MPTKSSTYVTPDKQLLNNDDPHCCLGIVNKVIRLITQRIPVNKDPPTGNKAQELSDESSSNSITSPTSDKSAYVLLLRAGIILLAPFSLITSNSGR